MSTTTTKTTLTKTTSTTTTVTTTLWQQRQNHTYYSQKPPTRAQFMCVSRSFPCCRHYVRCFMFYFSSTQLYVPHINKQTNKQTNTCVKCLYIVPRSLYVVSVYICLWFHRPEICQPWFLNLMHRSIAGHNPYNLFVLTIVYSKIFTTRYLLTIGHMAMFVV